MKNALIDIGLSKLQAETYLYLLENGSIVPRSLMNKLNISRTNTYKVLESLERIGLAKRESVNNKTTYFSEDPSALASLVAEKRNSVITLEHKVDRAMQDLRAKYGKHQTNIEIKSYTGKESVINAYKQQYQQKLPIYFLKSRADITFMGFEIMDKIRKIQGKLSGNRYGITTDSSEAPINTNIDKNTNLTRTWINEKDYTAPVEWSVSGDTLIIQVFDQNGKSITIKNALVAESFKQFWQLTDRALRNNTDYALYPIKASRKI